jgi:hypothetical protein
VDVDVKTVEDLTAKKESSFVEHFSEVKFHSVQCNMHVKKKKNSMNWHPKHCSI